MATGGNGKGESSFGSRLFYGGKKRKDIDDDNGDNGGERTDISADDSVDDPEFQLVSSNSNDSSDNIDEPGVSGVGEGHGDASDVGEGTSASVGDAGSGDREPARGRQRGRGRGQRVKKVGRSRSRGEWECEKSRRLRNKGEAYISVKSKKPMPARKPGPPCSDGCFLRINEEGRKALFEAFWDLKDYDKQNAYLLQRVTQVPVKRRYSKEPSGRALRVNYSYRVSYLGEDISVCRAAFLSIHGIAKRRLHWSLQKRRASATGTPPGDERGRRPSANKILGRKLECVHEHIQSLPTTSSHYSRAKSPHRKYLESGGTIKGLYEKYKVWMREYHSDVLEVSQRFYTKIFTTEYNIAFRSPKKDTCSTCDSISATIEEKKQKGEDYVAHQTKLEEHKALGSFVQNILKEKTGDQEEEEGLTVRNVAMDLQQTLPCPRLSTGIAYYLRKLWVYNFCIFDLQKNLASMFIWDEETGGRGSDEVASCLLKWLDLRQDEGEGFEVLRIFCDNCAGQNKNLFVLLAALRKIHDRTLFRIEIVFMISGHSFLPCDRAFGVIEKKLRVTEGIHTTDIYAATIKDAKRPPYEVIQMKRDEFFDVKALISYVTKRQTPVSFSQACQLVVSNKYNEGYIIKTDYNFNDTPNNTHRCRLMKGNRKYAPKFFNLADVPLLSKYPQERVLNDKKVNDLQTLTAFLGPSSKQWMLDLIARQRELAGNVAVTRHDEEDVGSDAEQSDVQDYDDPTPVVRH